MHSPSVELARSGNVLVRRREAKGPLLKLLKRRSRSAREVELVHTPGVQGAAQRRYVRFRTWRGGGGGTSEAAKIFSTLFTVIRSPTKNTSREAADFCHDGRIILGWSPPSVSIRKR